LKHLLNPLTEENEKALKKLPSMSSFSSLVITDIITSELLPVGKKFTKNKAKGFLKIADENNIEAILRRIL
jgi:hypothetical protein